MEYGLIGKKLGHSWSPQIHAQLGSIPYALVEREPEEAEDFLRAGSWKGLNVTIPYRLRHSFDIRMNYIFLLVKLPVRPGRGNFQRRFCQHQLQRR